MTDGPSGQSTSAADRDDTPSPPLAGLDIYTMRARWAPALLACLPLLVLGTVALPYLEGYAKLWPLTSVGVTTFASLTARKAGHRVQPLLFAAWGGTPTTARLRFSSATSPDEIRRRHRQVARVLGDGLLLPTQSQEEADPRAADLAYEASMGRIVHLIRHESNHALATTENRNYGFARNLLGLKSLGLTCSWLGLLLSLTAGVVVAIVHDAPTALALAFPALASAVALLLWRQVDEAFVRPSAESFADRVVEALDTLEAAQATLPHPPEEATRHAD